MALTSGTKLGPYEIQSALGAGGMGEVYRARDTRLDRIVAVKILPAHLSSGNEFKQRFEREARTISSLNHPHICQLFDVGRDGSTDYLVMEFLDGETLAERVRGGLALNDLLKIAIDVAEALAVAHGAGIVHRDLKPGNVMLTKSGAKLMDFGLAKPALAGAPGSESAPLLSAARTMSGPTPASPLTTAGSIVGTIQYMSPEQIEGREADAASDIFAFGAVLYEMATGRRAFEGKSQITVASAILEKNPEPISTLRPLSPVALDQLVATCLAKEREERFQSAHDLALQLKAIAHAPQASTVLAGEPGHTMRSWLLPAVAAVLLIAAALFFYLWQRGNAPALSVRAYIPPPPGTAFRPTGFDAGPVAVSPNGKMLAFTAVDERGVTNLWVRPLDAAQANMLQGTEDAAFPFWSPDSKYLGFAASDKLKKIAVTGGEAQTLADHAESRCDWGADGTILFMDDHASTLRRVSSAGGEITTVTNHDSDEYADGSASFLPDGKHFLYVGYRVHPTSRIKVGTLGKPDSSIVLTEGNVPRFSSGRLLFVRSGKILAQPFDPATFKLSGDPQVLGEASAFSVSPSGVLAYHESSANSELKVFDRSGNVVATPGPLADYSSPWFSPDGKSISADIRDQNTGKRDVWIFPVAGGPPTRVTFGPDDDFRATWSPDGGEIAFAVRDGNKFSVHKRPLDGSSPDETLYETSDFLFGTVQDWSPEGKYLSLDMQHTDRVYKIWILPLSGKREPFLSAASSSTRTDAEEYDGHFSPDGRWMSFFSYESGRPEVYLVPFQSNGVKYQASTNGGWVSRFAGNEFFFVTMGNRLMAARYVTQPNFHLEEVHPLFQLDLPNFAGPNFDVSHDGQRFVVLTADRAKTSPITLETNWTAALDK